MPNRISSSLGEPYPERIKKYWKITKPNVFIGMYDYYDYLSLMRTKGKRYIYWCGGDILRLNKVKQWILKKFPADHYCDNEIEQKELARWRIKAKIKLTFLGNPNDYQIFFKANNKIHIYSIVKPKKEKEYSLDIIKKIAKKFPNYIFHIFGYINVPFPYTGIVYDNIIYEEKISEEKFNEEIKKYHCAFRPNEWDGFSDILCKSVLMGQYPISKISYPHIWNYKTEEELVKLFAKLGQMTKPNYQARNWYLKNLNQFPFLL